MNSKFARVKSKLKTKSKEGIILLDGKINKTTSMNVESVIKKFKGKIEMIDRVLFFISGSGGDFYACLKIINLLESLPVKLMIIAFDKVKSGSFLITQAKRERRFATRGTKFTFHRSVYVFEQEQLTQGVLVVGQKN